MGMAAIDVLPIRQIGASDRRVRPSQRMDVVAGIRVGIVWARMRMRGVFGVVTWQGFAARHHMSILAVHVAVARFYSFDLLRFVFVIYKMDDDRVCVRRGWSEKKRVANT